MNENLRQLVVEYTLTHPEEKLMIRILETIDDDIENLYDEQTLIFNLEDDE